MATTPLLLPPCPQPSRRRPRRRHPRQQLRPPLQPQQLSRRARSSKFVARLAALLPRGLRKIHCALTLYIALDDLSDCWHYISHCQWPPHWSQFCLQEEGALTLPGWSSSRRGCSISQIRTPETFAVVACAEIPPIALMVAWNVQCVYTIHAPGTSSCMKHSVMILGELCNFAGAFSAASLAKLYLRLAQHTHSLRPL